MATYRRRVIDTEIDELMTGVAALAINGPRATGKTATASARAATTYALDDPRTRSIIDADPGRIVTGPPPILIDEWQRMPASWDMVRRAVDADRTPGRFLLTGSASPRVPPTHTGAGRIVSLRMRPMTLMERGVEIPSVSLAGLMTGDPSALTGTTDVTADRYANEILASGFPGLRDLPDRVVRAELDSYISQVINVDIVEAGSSVRKAAALRRWLQAYAAGVSSTTSYEKIRDAASVGRVEKPARSTALRYLDALESLWLIEPVPGWISTANDLARLTASPKHQLVDPALAGRLRRVTMDTLIKGQAAGPLAPRHTTLFGALFESLVTLDVRVYAQAAEASVFHFRDFGGEHEVDLIVEGPDQRVLAIEVKLAAVVGSDDGRHLRWLRDRLGDRMLDAVIVTTGREAYRRADGIAVVPAALLGP